MSDKGEGQKDIEQFEFIVNLMNQERSEEEYQKFKVMTYMVDSYRGDDFFGVFTEFSDFLN